MKTKPSKQMFKSFYTKRSFSQCNISEAFKIFHKSSGNITKQFNSLHKFVYQDINYAYETELN